MEPAKRPQLEDLLSAALDLDPAERRDYLVQACQGDAHLLGQVEKELRAAEAHTAEPLPGNWDQVRQIAEKMTVGPPSRASQVFPCPHCARELVLGNRFCPGCGAALSPPQQERTAAYQHTPPRARATAFTPGQLLAGRYRIVALLGQGGMGAVYRADDLTLGQSVALKFLSPHLTGEPRRLDRFRNEVKLARQVSHPHVCRVYDIGEEEGLLFLTMEYIDGEDLAALLRQVGRLPEERGLEMARQLCLGLAAAHDRGILHRDLKPANVMLDGRGQVRITDFGLASFADATAQEEIRSGTPAYQAPEVLAGQEVTVRSDLYALGLVLYELFTGKRPFPAASRAELVRLQAEEEPLLPSSHVSGLNSALERIILRCLDRKPAARPRSAYEVVAALPGADPLAAALAAGETPSPQMVAAAGSAEGLRPAVAASCFAGVLILLVLVTLLAGQMLLCNRVPLPERPEFLVRQAQQLLGKLGHVESPQGKAWGFEGDGDYLRHLDQTDSSLQRWERLATARPAAFFFWYRQAPLPLLPTRLFNDFGDFINPGIVNLNDPPTTVPGMAEVRLDPAGRLLALRVMPATVNPAAGAEEPDWALLFSLAELDPARFRSVQPTRRPPDQAQQHLAWEETSASAEGTLRVEAAALAGKVIFFQVFGPGSPPAGTAFIQEPAAVASSLQLSEAVWVGSLWLAALLLAARNWRLGRGDRQGAARLFWGLFVLELSMYLLRASHLPSPHELVLLKMGVAVALLGAGLIWLYYLAVEPLARRFWPQALISWSRLLAGRLRDPLVGRDILVGVLAGTLVVLLYQLMHMLSGWLGQPPSVPVSLVTPFPLEGRQQVGGWLLTIPLGVEGGLLYWLLMFLVLRLVLRNQLLAAIVFALVYAGLWYLNTSSIISSLCNILISLLAVTVLIRCGLLASAVVLMVHLLLIRVTPLTPDLSSWYSGYGLWTLGVVVGLATYGWITSVGEQPLLGKVWLGEE